MSAVLELPQPVPQVEMWGVWPEGAQPIAAFLAKHPGLLEVLNTGLHHFSQLFPFPDRSGFTLALETDPEIAGWKYLAVSVQTTLPVAEAHGRLQRFDEQWWLEHVAQFGDVLLFDLEYV